jgi:FkbM family methyltransferase
LPRLELLVVVDPACSDPVSAAVRHGSNPNEVGLELMAQAVQPGDRVLDLGGHIGLFALTAAALGCEVLTVEASRHNASLLATAARLNGFSNLHLVNCAVGSGTGLAAFCEDGPFGSVAGDRVPRPVTSRVPVLTVENLLAGMGWERLAFVKMDVEGSELAATAGMQRILESARAPAVLFESNEHALHFFGQTPQALHAAFCAAGYTCHQVGARRLTLCSPDEPQGPTCVDYLAVKGKLPTLPKRWEVSAGFTQAELIEQFRADMTGANPDLRASAARRLATSPPALVASPVLQAGLCRLHDDKDDRVRTAACWHSRQAA